MGTSSGSRAQQRQTNANLLLLQNLLSCQPGTSPFTLIQDSINQPAKPLLRHYIEKAAAFKTPIIFVSFETYPPPAHITHFIKARRKDPSTIRNEILTVLNKHESKKSLLLIIDTLHPLSHLPPPFSLPTYLLSLTSLSPTTSLSQVSVYHTDIPSPSPTTLHPISNPYLPTPQITLPYHATTLLKTSSLPQTISRQHAQTQSLPPPLFGIDEDRPGVLTPLSISPYPSHSQVSTSSTISPLSPFSTEAEKGLLLTLEHRRKSGRVGTIARFYLPPHHLPSSSSPPTPIPLDEHPLFRPRPGPTSGESRGEGREVGEGGTFNLGLTERQRRAREGVVLPYYDAQRRVGGGGGGGGVGGLGAGGVGGSQGGGDNGSQGQVPAGRIGEGGRILYEMGIEDDFDEEEDEI